VNYLERVELIDSLDENDLIDLMTYTAGFIDAKENDESLALYDLAFQEGMKCLDIKVNDDHKENRQTLPTFTEDTTKSEYERIVCYNCNGEDFTVKAFSHGVLLRCKKCTTEKLIYTLSFTVDKTNYKRAISDYSKFQKFTQLRCTKGHDNSIIGED